MTNVYRKRAAFSIAMLVAVLVCCLAAQDKKPVKDSDIAVIVNPGNPVDSISSTELRKIFSGQKQSWAGGLSVDLFVRAPQARERDVLLEQVLKMSESEYKAFWVKKVYSGESQREPLALFSNGMQLEAVRAEKGGIALVSLQDLHQGVKVLKVNGRLPGTPGYTLQ
jgi:ABC-type phosphate transport system substrate-binding protein